WRERTSPAWNGLVAPPPVVTDVSVVAAPAGKVSKVLASKIDADAAVAGTPLEFRLPWKVALVLACAMVSEPSGMLILPSCPGRVGDVELALERDAGGLERGRVDVGDVVADDVEARLIDVQAGEAGEQCAGQCHSRVPILPSLKLLTPSESARSLLALATTSR